MNGHLLMIENNGVTAVFNAGRANANPLSALKNNDRVVLKIVAAWGLEAEQKRSIEKLAGEMNLKTGPLFAELDALEREFRRQCATPQATDVALLLLQEKMEPIKDQVRDHWSCFLQELLALINSPGQEVNPLPKPWLPKSRRFACPAQPSSPGLSAKPVSEEARAHRRVTATALARAPPV